MATEIWRSNPGVVFSPLEGSLALLDTVNNVYYTLNGIGPFLWERLADGCSLAELCQSVESQYDVSPEVARSDIAEWLKKMTVAGLVVEANG